MTANPASAAKTSSSVFELKAATFTLPVVRLLGADMDAVATQLGAKVDQAPDFFRNTPVVIDLSGLPGGAGDVEFPVLVGLMRGYGMIPVGVRGGTDGQNRAAQAMELAILGDAFTRRPQPSPKAESRAGKDRPGTARGVPVAATQKQGEQAPGARDVGGSGERQNQPAAGFKLVTRPVRSGQRVYAPGGDLSVVAPVSSGAELMADGNIHVYGPLRGRAMAGMKGDTSARIFCQDLQAELISVAGHYRVSENIPAELKGAPVQIYLDKQVLRIERL
jgi:septum site-determining protein MinC